MSNSVSQQGKVIMGIINGFYVHFQLNLQKGWKMESDNKQRVPDIDLRFVSVTLFIATA